MPRYLLLLLVLAAASAQTFQYSHGWGSGKRGGRDPDLLLMARVLTPCRWSKLMSAVGAGQVDERLGPCDPDEDPNRKKRHFKSDYNTEPLLEAFA